MDTTDARLTFDDKGVCDHCINFNNNVRPHWHTDQRGWQVLQGVVARIKREEKGKAFDSILGLSGGLDSSYLLHIAVTALGLRPLVFHVDGGWNSEIAVHNIEVLVNKLGLDLFTEVIDWEEMKDFQLSFFKAAVPHIDIPQDHAFIATLYQFAYKHSIRFILNGGNYSTEGVRNPLEWIYHATDMKHLKDLHSRFGQRALVKYPFSGILWHKVYLRYVKNIQVIKPLNYVPYVQSEASDLLRREYGWQPYPQKHFESRFTKFYEGYWLPAKFGYDTRRVQYSSLILTQQITREEALQKLATPALDEGTIDREFEYVAKKLGISQNELQAYFDAPNRSYRDYASQERLFSVGSRLMSMMGLERSVKR
jgi:N-acetyl sugar amidotransferase